MNDVIVLITLETIKGEYNSALSMCKKILPIHKWVLNPKGVDLTRHKTKYGLATCDGMTLISRAFIGTSAINKLRATLRHELAHLAVGLNQGHNRTFKRWARRFGALDPVDRSETLSVLDNINYKYQVTAHLEDGTQRDLGGVHRKTRRYTDYPGNGSTASIDGLHILSFSFEQDY